MTEPIAIYATVCIRRGNGWNVKPEAEQIDGVRHRFTRGWRIGPEDSSIYVGETAWIPDWGGWPKDAPVSISSGDLVDIEEDRL